ncbi:MAG: succinate dehydrogenase [Candidatus Marinimicrobia bacterium]|nr:succinate dehydrogenase [Candidatus Neomarinimicrobiota bacterium]MCH8068270.1 succinate dehydrogenase [Candidatus Neomarinimicrobiota bacterium]
MSKSSFAETFRTDRWWLEPLLVLIGLSAFIIYSTWSAWQGQYYWWSGGSEGFGGYLSPFYSPPLFIKEGIPGTPPIWHAWFGPWPDWLYDFKYLPASPAWLILIFPLSFRFTCYYYRKAYYRAFTGAPPACAVGAIPRNNYKGETGLLVIQNLHRYTMYFAIVIIFILTYDAMLSFFNDGRFGVGVGSIVLLINPILLGAYTFGCHSFRHLVGGSINCFSCSKSSRVRYKGWRFVSFLNGKHQMFAWLSLFWVGFSDVYVRLVSMGFITDLNTWGV